MRHEPKLRGGARIARSTDRWVRSFDPFPASGEFSADGTRAVCWYKKLPYGTAVNLNERSRLLWGRAALDAAGRLAKARPPERRCTIGALICWPNLDGEVFAYESGFGMGGEPILDRSLATELHLAIPGGFVEHGRSITEKDDDGSIMSFEMWFYVTELFGRR